MPTTTPPPAGPADPPDPLVGTVLNDRYRIVERVAAGSMGVIYRGERVRLGRSVAIKFLDAGAAASQEFVQRFEVEAQALSRLSHPNCVSIFDFGVGTAPYLVMDFVHGATLRQLIDRSGAMPAARAIQITRQILAGLAHAHGRGIIHRDVKAGNVMLTEATGTGDHIRILDFGLAKLQSAAMSLSAAGGKNIIGTPAYMSPEQAQADRDIDPRSDIYGVGILLYEMLVGHKPFDGEMYQVLQMQIHQRPPAPREQPAGAKLSPALEAAILRALEKDPARRFADALEFSAALADTPEGSAGPYRYHPETAEVTTQPAPRPRTRVTLLLAAAVLLVLGGAAVAMLLGRGGEADSRRAKAAPRVTADAGARAAFDAMVIGFSRRPTRPARPADAGADADADADGGVSRDSAQVGATGDGPADGDASRDAAAEDGAPDDGDLSPPRDAEQATPTPTERGTAMADARLKRLIKLHKRQPSNARVAYALGRAYSRRGWSRNALQAYAVALRKAPSYSRRRVLLQDLVAALDSARSAGLAERLLAQIGRPALPYVQRAARSHRNRSARVRAARLLVRISSRR